MYRADHRQRDIVLKGFYDTKEYMGGTKRFSRIPLELLELLLLENHIDHEERHNNSPSVRDMVVLAKQLKDKGYDFYFSGYVVSPDREDYRTSIDTIHIKYYFDNSNHINNRVISKFFENADEKDIEQGSMRFWYD
jgi:hypothetical protein